MSSQLYVSACFTHFFPRAFLLVLPHRPLITYALESSIYLVYPICRYLWFHFDIVTHSLSLICSSTAAVSVCRFILFKILILPRTLSACSM